VRIFFGEVAVFLASGNFFVDFFSFLEKIGVLGSYVKKKNKNFPEFLQTKKKTFFSIFSKFWRKMQIFLIFSKNPQKLHIFFHFATKSSLITKRSRTI
jgi:hypothetical protein